MKFFFAQRHGISTPTVTEYQKIEHVSASFLIHTLASLLTKIVTTNQAEPYIKDEYMGDCKSLISIEDYLFRFYKYLDQEKSLYILFLIYLSKYLELGSDYKLNEMNVHRLVACSLLLAYKQLMDDRYNNVHFAKIAGVSLSELNHLEIKFLTMLNFNVYVSTENFVECYHGLLDYACSVTQKHSASTSPSV